MCEVKRSEVKGDRGLKEEEGKCKEKQILLERLVFMNPRSSAFMDRGEKSTLFQQGGGFLWRPGAIITTAGVQGCHSRQKWEFLILCESAGIIIITPAAKSDPAAAHIAVGHRRNRPSGQTGEFREEWRTKSFICFSVREHEPDYVLVSCSLSRLALCCWAERPRFASAVNLEKTDSGSGLGGHND